MNFLVQYSKDAGFVAQYWGHHAHLTEVADQKSSNREARKQVNLAQSHTNYQVLMMAEELIGIIFVDKPTDVIHPVTGKKLGTFTLQKILMNYIKMKDSCQAIAEVHQESIQMPTNIIIPCTLDAKTIICMMNKNLPAYLWYTLKE
jgi:hypothetical protein